MFDFTTFMFFITASSVALAIPGPTVALVITRSLSDGRRVSVPLAIGIGAGTLVGSSAALAGAGAVLSASAAAFTAVKLIGAAYLIYLGVMLFCAEPTPQQTDRPLTGTSAFKGLRDGFLITLLNPKSIAFSAAFMPQFIAPNTSYLLQGAILVCVFSALATLNALAFALGTDVLRRFVQRINVLRKINQIGGGLLIVSGIAGVFLKRPVS